MRPSALLCGRLGDLAMDAAVLVAGGEISAAIANAARDFPEAPNPGRLVLDQLKADAEREAKNG